MTQDDQHEPSPQASEEPSSYSAEPPPPPEPVMPTLPPRKAPRAPRVPLAERLPASPASSIGTLLLAIPLALAAGALGGWGYSSYRGSRPGARTAAETAPREPAPPPAETKPAPPPAPDPKVLARIDELANQLGALQKRVEETPKAEPEPSKEVADLREKVDHTAEVASKVEALPGKVSDLDQRVDALKERLQQVDSLKQDLESLQARVEKAAAATSSPARTEDVDVSGQALSQGEKLFEQKKYAEADALFKNLEGSHSQDARVWYYAALSHGFATGQWTGETERLVLKGVERERAGTPKREAIDATFANLSANTGKDWLAAYRRRAASAR